ncbi:DUF4184 family protein [Budviciaceae bacterium CWB-B4]|uniref:DUF4184 family protein n=1 Tax=Limnobaculum xujianqingii TaxID=2738837 RepID=A0A9D7FZS7_9GAMM|nr:DUF4184 family protein [Limnobaculum xujianqingii]MBK5075050.1 DUF4184 family protein [Limnobaculum xujianqingii]MBK5178415.1 DUF4184 family protein [Limnobaculum xujianqingii]
MPFTFAHPAIVLPLGSFIVRRYSMTGLIAGSVVPDFEYFFRMEVKSLYSHSLSGIFLFDLPVALLLTFIFHCLVRDSLINHLPRFLYCRVSYLIKLDWVAYASRHKSVLLWSIMLGIFSHLLWDSFTHKDAFFVSYLHYSSINVKLLDYSIPLYKLLQHLSTLLGGLIIFTYLWFMPKNNTISSHTALKYWLVVFSLSLAISVIRIALINPDISSGMIVVTSLSAFMISLILAPVVLKMKRARKQSSGLLD